VSERWLIMQQNQMMCFLIGCEFFMQILFSFPKSLHNFKSAYDGIKWRNNEEILKVV
jgi:deoxyribodipyrimidine photo-lyase